MIIQAMKYPKLQQDREKYGQLSKILFIFVIGLSPCLKQYFSLIEPYRLPFASSLFRWTRFLSALRQSVEKQRLTRSSPGLQYYMALTMLNSSRIDQSADLCTNQSIIISIYKLSPHSISILLQGFCVFVDLCISPLHQKAGLHAKMQLHYLASERSLVSI